MSSSLLPFARPRARAAMAAGLAIAVGLMADPAQAQDTVLAGASRRYQVAFLPGYQWFDRSAALRDAPMVGFRVSSAVGNPAMLPFGLSLGVGAGFSRPVTRGDYFPWARQPYFSDTQHRNDTTLLFEVSQRVTFASYGADAALRFGGGGRSASRFGIGDVQLELGLGAGGFTFWMDPEQNRRNETYSGPMFSAGGGIAVPVGATSTVRLRVDDIILTSFNRERFSLSDRFLSEDLFPNPSPAPPPAKSTVHNLRLSAGFSFVPGSR